MSLRARNIVSRYGPVAQAVRQWDLDSIKSMFENGEASIFDITEYGEDYLYLCFVQIDVRQDYLKLKAMMNYFIRSGMKLENSLVNPLKFIMFQSWSNNLSSKEEFAIQDVIREILPYIPESDLSGLDFRLFDYHNIQGPISQLLLQQVAELGLQQKLESEIEIYDDWRPCWLLENKRMMLLDPQGYQLKSLLDFDKKPSFFFTEVQPSFSLPQLVKLLPSKHMNQTPF